MQALGDNLITLSMLSQSRKKIDVIGTRLTLDVAKLLGVEEQFNIRPLYEQIPAFYDMRKEGIRKALRDAMIFRCYIKRQALRELVFEKEDIRPRLLTFGLARYHAVKTEQGIYYDRQRLIEKTVESAVTLKPALKPATPVKTVVIAPHSRLREKDIAVNDLSSIINVLKAAGLHLRLVDYRGELERFREIVDDYVSGTTLEAVKDLIVESDFLIGCDSFLIHLAYHFDKAFFIVFKTAPSDFLPPG